MFVSTLNAVILGLLLAPGRTLVPIGGGWESHGPPFIDVTAVVADPNDDKTVYACARDHLTGQNGVFKSTDGGLDWLTLAYAPAGQVVKRLAVNPAAAAQLGALTYDGGHTRLYRSDDSGSTWYLVHSFPGNYDGSLFYDSTGIAYLLANGYLFSDEEGPWNRANGRSELHSAWPGPGGQVFWTELEVTYWGGPWWPPALSIQVIRSDHGHSATWFSNAPCLDMAVVYAPSDPNVAYLSDCRGISRSMDGGQSWVGTGLYGSSIVVDPHDPATVYALSGSVFQSRDGGNTWLGLDLASAAATQITLSSSGHLLYAATSEGVFSRTVPDDRVTRIVPPRAD